MDARKESSFLSTCTFTKTVLMILVIIGHSIVFWNERWINWTPVFKAPEFALAYDWLNSFHVFSFTLISGYIFAFKMNEGGYRSYKNFVKNKTCRLLVPYVFVASIWVIPISCLCFHWNVQEVFDRFILCMKPNQLWFLWMLFWIFVLIWPLYRLIKNNDLVLITVISVSYILGAVGQQFLPNLFCIWTALTYMPSFLIGLYMRIKEESDDKSVIMQIPWWVWFFIHMLLFVLYKMVIGDHDSLLFLPIKLVSHFLLNAVGAIMGFMTLNRLGQALNWKNSKNFLRLAKLSMPIYLFHQQIIYIVIYLLNGKANPYINALANYIACFTISIAISSILIRYKATRFLVGEK